MSVRLCHSCNDETYYITFLSNEEYMLFKQRFGTVLSASGWLVWEWDNHSYYQVVASGYKMSSVKQLLEQKCGLVQDWSDANGSRIFYHMPPVVVSVGERLYAQTGGANCDFTLVSSTGEQFKVHKLVLSARSEVLQRAFDNGELSEHCVDLKENELPLPHADDKAVDAFVKAIYTGKYELKYADEPESVLALLQLVDMYMVDDIKVYIERDLMRCVNKANAKAMVAIADQYKMDMLNDVLFCGL